MYLADPVQPTDVAHQLTANVGGQVLDAAQGLAPLAVPFVLAVTAVGWVLHKFGVGRRVQGFLDEREAYARNEALNAKRARSVARRKAYNARKQRGLA